jgi:hypothetical protein
MIIFSRISPESTGGSANRGGCVFGASLLAEQLAHHAALTATLLWQGAVETQVFRAQAKNCIIGFPTLLSALSFFFSQALFSSDMEIKCEPPAHLEKEG